MKKFLFFLLLFLLLLAVIILFSLKNDLADEPAAENPAKDNDTVSEKEKSSAKKYDQEELQKVIQRGREVGQREASREQQKVLLNYEKQFWDEPREFYLGGRTENIFETAVKNIAAEFEKAMLSREFYCRGFRCRLAARFKDENAMQNFEEEIRKSKILTCAKESIVAPNLAATRQYYELRIYFNCENKL